MLLATLLLQGILLGAGRRMFLHGSYRALCEGWVGCHSDSTPLLSLPRAPSTTPPTICSFSFFETQVQCPLLIPESHVHRSTASAWLNVFPVRFISDIVSSAALISCSLSVSCHERKVCGSGLGSRLHPQPWSCARWRMCTTRPVG